MAFKRLIEEDFPISEISNHSAKDKSVRKGHIQRYHIWWARRPLAACRAIILSALLPDPNDEECPQEFLNTCKKIFFPIDYGRIVKPKEYRNLLKSFISDISSWENANNTTLISKAKKLIHSANLNGNLFLVDPFAGGGAIPLEINRFGLNSLAMDLNPIAYLIVKTLLDYTPKYKDSLIPEIEKWGKFIKKKASERLTEIYPHDKEKNMPFVYLWSRTIRCEGPNCGAEIPGINNLIISDRDKIGLKYLFDKEKRTIGFKLVNFSSPSELEKGTAKRNSITCPLCGFTLNQKKVSQQVKERGFGQKPIAVITLNQSTGKRSYRYFNEEDEKARLLANEKFKVLKSKNLETSAIPDEALPLGTFIFRVTAYDIDNWGKLFTNRQAYSIRVYFEILEEIYDKLMESSSSSDKEYVKAVTTILALTISNMIHYNTNVSIFILDHMVSTFIQGVHIGIKIDYGEVNPLIDKLVGGFDFSLKNVVDVLKNVSLCSTDQSTVSLGNAMDIPLPDEIADAVITDPPYYSSLLYANVSDMFYVWLKRFLQKLYPKVFNSVLTNKNNEIVQISGLDKDHGLKSKEVYEEMMRKALAECNRILKPNGIAIIIFAHKSTEGWEALLNAVIKSGWTITASWPIDTERGARMRAHRTASLASSIHLVCRKRISTETGDWRNVLSDMREKVHNWLPRLTEEGIVGADAIFSCIGPALEVYSRFNSVEKASGDSVSLEEFLQYVWETVAHEALDMVFKGAKAEGLEEDARLSAMWLWTLSFSTDSKKMGKNNLKKSNGKVKYEIKYDVARKIAQAVGVNLDNLTNLVEIKRDKAKLFSIEERSSFILAKKIKVNKTVGKEKDRRKTLLESLEFEEVEIEPVEKVEIPSLGETLLDRLHQAMILFSQGRVESLKRFLIENRVNNDQRFWQLAQSFSALYPFNSSEKRLIDGILAMKKSFFRNL